MIMDMLLYKICQNIKAKNKYYLISYVRLK